MNPPQMIPVMRNMISQLTVVIENVVDAIGEREK